MLLPQIDLGAWTRVAEFKDEERAFLSLVPLESDYNTVGAFIESQVSAPASVDLDRWTNLVARGIEHAGYSGKVTVSTIRSDPRDAVVSFRYSDDPFVTPFVEAYRILDADEALYILTVKSQDSAFGAAAQRLDADRLALDSVLVPAAQVRARTPAVDHSQQRQDVEDLMALVSKFGATADVAAPASTADVAQTEFRKRVGEVARQRERVRAQEFTELVAILNYALTHTWMMPEPLRWLASREALVEKGLAWIEDASSLERTADRAHVLAVIAKICQYAIDVSFLIRRRHPDVAGLVKMGESFCELKLKLDVCTSLLSSSGESRAELSHRIRTLRALTTDTSRTMRLDILAIALTFVERLETQGNEIDPDELWSTIASQARGLELLAAVQDVGALLMGIGRLASDAAWRVASFVLDATMIIEHPNDMLAADRKEMERQTNRMYELQRAASCHAHGISVDEYAVSNELIARRRQGRTPPHWAMFLRNLRTSRRYMMANRFTGSSIQNWPIEPPRVSLESALARAMPEDVLAMAVGGGWDSMGMGRLATVGGPDDETATWQKIVRIGIERSRFVLMVPSDSKGIKWEVEQLASMGMLAHTVWVMPPADAFPSGEREWELGRATLALVGLSLPPFQREGAFVILDSSGSQKQLVPFDALWSGELTTFLTRESSTLP